MQHSLDALLSQISCFRLNLTSLNISNQSAIPAKGLRAFSKKITTLTSLTCSNLVSFYSSDINLIAKCFPLLEELYLSYPLYCINRYSYSFLAVESLSLALIKLRKVNLTSHDYLNNQLLLRLFKNCKLLEEAILLYCCQITNTGIAYALRKRPTLRSLSFSNNKYATHITSHFTDSLVSLRSLSCFDLLSFYISDELLTSIAIIFSSLPLRRLVLQNCTGYSYFGIYCLLYNCRSIQHLDLQNATFINDQHVAQLSLFLGDLRYVNLSKCSMLIHLALFALVRNCPSLSEIKMEYTSIGKNSVENSNSSMNFVVNRRLKSLCLAHNSWLRNESLIRFASIFPNLQLLDLGYCYNISEEGIYQVLKRCCKIRHLNLTSCYAVKLYGMNVDIPKLEVLNLSDTCIGDETLHVISKSCCGLLQLSLECCYDVTEKGVKHVLQNCTQLKEINLGCCIKVHANIVAKMIFLRPSLRKITAPPRYRVGDKNRELFSSHGCLVC